MSKPIKKQSELKWIFNNTKEQGLLIILLSIFYSVLAYLGVAGAKIAKEVIDYAVGKNIDGLINSGIIFLLVIVAQFLIRVISNHLIFYIDAKLEISMKENLFKNILKKEYGSIISYHTGELLNRINSDVLVITGAVTTIIPQVVYLVVKLVSVFVFLWSIDKTFASVFLIGGILVYLVAKIFKKRLKSLHIKIQKTDGESRSFMQEILANLLVVKVFNSDNTVLEKTDNLLQENYKVRKKRNYLTILTGSGLSFVFSLAYLYGIIWGGINIISGAITFGTLTAILTLVTQIKGPINELSNILPRYYAATGSASRIMEIEAIKEEKIKNKKINIKEIYNNLNKIKFKNVIFSYDRDIILNNINIDIDKNKFYVITGSSGEGKSTFIKLLMGIYKPNQGSVEFLLNNKNKYKADKGIRKIFAFVPQGNFILSGTIKENISFTKPKASKEEIIKAAKLSCAHEFIKEFPHGYNTVIGEKGQGLSEGQVQRLAIARAIVSDSPILILDESTSALDEKTEYKLLKNIKGLKNKTCIIISHKKAAFNICDKEINITQKQVSVKEINRND